MDETFKSIRVGTVDFFGILMPGLLAIVICTIGFFIPILILILNIIKINVQAMTLDPKLIVFTLFVLVVFSYVLGYILRLSSPDELDRISARNIIAQERDRIFQRNFFNRKFSMAVAQSAVIRAIAKKIAPTFMKQEEQSNEDFIREDGWPYDPNNTLDKYPYLNFRTYLNKRGHEHLTKDLVTWEPAGEAMAKRSKSVVNKMKINVRIYCPQLTGLLESKEGHIRLMSGTWITYKFSIPLVGIAWIIITVFAGLRQSSNWYYIYSFVDFSLLVMLLFSKKRIEKLFHYRRVSELFHIVQAAYIAQQVKQERKKSK